MLDAGPGCVQIDDDGDGLSNLEELELGTEVDNADSDGDGLEDGVELTLKTDPLNPDSDGDTVTDRIDNCPGVPNENQLDLDKNGVGTACDIDESAGVISGGDCAGGDDSLVALLLLGLVLWVRRFPRAAERGERGATNN